MSYIRCTTGALLGVVTFACLAQAPAMKGKSDVKKQAFGNLPDGAPIELYTLSNAQGMQAGIMTYGGAVVSLTAPDRGGKYADVVLGMQDLAGYLTPVPYFGAIIGRYGNRIGKAQFTLDGKVFHLPANDAANTLHGGLKGFDKHVWKATAGSSAEGETLELTYTSQDGEEGFPGSLTTKVVYTLTAKNDLNIDYTATTDKNTVVNLTNHSYFNLAGHGDILKHELTIHASKFTPVDAGLIPTGELKSVESTPFDFRKATAVGARISADNEQIRLGHGYDHNWVLDNKTG